MKCYRYNPTTFEYEGEEEAVKSPGLGALSDEWLAPANCTMKPPPKRREGCAVVFDAQLQAWYNERDNRGTWVVDKATHRKFQYGMIGELPSGLTAEEPNWEWEAWLRFDVGSGKWVFDESMREGLLAHLWGLRKEIRSLKCAADISYGGRLVHADAESVNDVMLAYQDAAASGDMAAKRRWVCADGDAEFTGQDFLQILQAYRARREQLVLESDEGWRRDALKRGEHLLMTLSELNSELAGLQAAGKLE